MKLKLYHYIKLKYWFYWYMKADPLIEHLCICIFTIRHKYTHFLQFLYFTSPTFSPSLSPYLLLLPFLFLFTPKHVNCYGVCLCGLPSIEFVYASRRWMSIFHHRARHWSAKEKRTKPLKTVISRKNLNHSDKAAGHLWPFQSWSDFMNSIFST